MGGRGNLKMTISGVIPAIKPMMVALAPRLSAYRKIGLSMMIWQDRKLRKKNQNNLWTLRERRLGGGLTQGQGVGHTPNTCVK